MLSLGKRIKKARKNAGLTQEDLAERIGVSRTAISRFELGEIEPGLRNLTALAMELKVSADYLLDIPAPTGTRELSPEAWEALQTLLRTVKPK